METTLFYIIVAIIVFDYLFTRFLEYLNQSNRSKNLPNELQGIYDEEQYAKQQNYETETGRFGMITSTFSFILILAMLFFNGFEFIDTISRSITDNSIWVSIIFFGIISGGSLILNMPFSWYSTFVIEEKYGFNKTTPKTFILDTIKSIFLGAILGGGILYLVILFYNATGHYFWLWVWGLITFFMIFMMMFYSNLIVPLFNKQKPLEEGELRDAINSFAEKAGFTLKNIYVIDGSKRSTKANAYFTGLGPKKRIVLFDTLINDLKTEEIVAVLAHEIGHYKKKHTLQALLSGIIQNGITLYILSLFINNSVLSQSIGADQHSFHMGLIAFGILYSPVSTIVGILMNIVSRKNEYQADRFAAGFNLGDSLISGLKRLSVKNLSNLTPHPAYVFVNYSHPPLLSRISAIKKNKGTTE